MTTVLVVDDDPHIREVICFALKKEGLQTEQAGDGRQALERFAERRPDLIILDIMMPELDGTEVCRQLRRESATPIIFLSSKDDEIDRILGLELGGDDYVTKPFSPRELVARVKAVLRRTLEATPADGTEPEPQPLLHGRLRLEPDSFKTFWGQTEVVLTVTEFGILRTLLQRRGKVTTRDGLMDGAYGLHKVVSDRTIDSHVRRVRAKLAAAGAEGEVIVTVHGLGYQLGPC